MENYAAQTDLTDQPLKNPDLELYTDGSSFGTLKSGPLPPNTSAQLAELVALTDALRLSKEQRVNIYTDSKYAFLILHAHAAIWKKREILTTIGAASHRNKRGYFNSFRDNSISCSPCWNQLWGNCQSCNKKKILTNVVEDTSDQVDLAIKDMQRSLLSLACMVMDHRLTLDFLLAKQRRGMCHRQYLLLHTYKHFRHCRGTCRLHSPRG
jgi:hypothetical protein